MRAKSVGDRARRYRESGPERPRKAASLLRALPKNDGLDGLEDDHQIQGDGHVLDVIEVELKLLLRLFEGRAVLVAHLRPAGKSGANNVPQVVIGNLLRKPFHELRALGPRTNEAHVATQNVPKLGDLIEARLA